jgi:hypothetical protein
MSLTAKANANGSITVSCGTDTLNIAVRNGQLVVSVGAAIAQTAKARPVKRSATPQSPLKPKPGIIPGPPANGPRTMIRVPGVSEDLSRLIGVGKAVCFEVKRNQSIAPRELWERMSIRC